eukprot:Hpha_TRINITY_DN27303_c0_g1::TRINITY_DN27303_c0_g1_i1::g.594::m.594
MMDYDLELPDEDLEGRAWSPNPILDGLLSLTKGIELDPTLGSPPRRAEGSPHGLWWLPENTLSAVQSFADVAEFDTALESYRREAAIRLVQSTVRSWLIRKRGLLQRCRVTRSYSPAPAAAPRSIAARTYSPSPSASSVSELEYRSVLDICFEPSDEEDTEGGGEVVVKKGGRADERVKRDAFVREAELERVREAVVADSGVVTQAPAGKESTPHAAEVGERQEGGLAVE